MSKTAARDMGVSVTADLVAAEAGVSRWTVNRAFRSDASISEKSRRRVLEAAEKLGYAPDLMASSLRSDRSNLVALLVDDFANPHKLVMLEQLTRALRRHGWDTLLVNTLDEADASTALLHASQRRVDAAVLIGIRFNEQQMAAAMGARRIRKLILFARYSDHPDTISVCVDDEAAMAAIAEYVMMKGYQRPLFLAGPQTVSAHLKRKETFVALWRRERGADPACISTAIYDPRLAFEIVSEQLGGVSADARPDIIVCENDALAMGAKDAISFRLGLSAPGDIAVTGFDDVPQAANPNYRLTTYRQPLSAMAEALVNVLASSDPAQDLSRFSGKLIIRGSA